MKTYLTVERSYSYGISIQEARFLDDDEKQAFSAEWRDLMMRPIPGTTVELKHLNWMDLNAALGERESIGSFAGSGNQVYEISREEWTALEELDAQKAEQEDAQKLETRKAELLKRKEQAERQMKNGMLPSQKEADQMRRNWINVQNEGGEGYVPHYYSQEEYERICDQLEGTIL